MPSPCMYILVLCNAAFLPVPSHYMSYATFQQRGQVGRLCIQIRHSSTRIHGVIYTCIISQALSGRSTINRSRINHPAPRAPVPGGADATAIDPREVSIEKFIDSRWLEQGLDRAVKYNVHWLDYKPAQDTWQSVKETG